MYVRLASFVDDLDALRCVQCSGKAFLFKPSCLGSRIATEHSHVGASTAQTGSHARGAEVLVVRKHIGACRLVHRPCDESHMTLGNKLGKRCLLAMSMFTPQGIKRAQASGSLARLLTVEHQVSLQT